MYFSPEKYVEEWSNFYYITLILKFLITFFLAFKTPSFLEKDDRLEEYIRECRVDIRRFKCS